MTKATKSKPRGGGAGAAAPAAAPPTPAAATGPFRSPVGCTSPGAAAAEAAFSAWCGSEGVRFPAARLAELPATGRGLVATRRILMHEVVVEVPDGAVLMAENCSVGGVLEEAGLCKPADEEFLEVQGLVIAVMCEKALGAKSRWAPYLALLPDDMTHMPLYWTRREFQELRGTVTYDKMVGVVQHPTDAPSQVPMLWAEVVSPFIAEHPELRLPGGEAGYDLYRWATSAVASYAFILGDDKYQAMVPVWDLLNHVTGAVNVRLHHCAKRHVLQMIATRDIGAGEELVNNYGALSNGELLRGYGYVEAANAHNHVQVPLRFILQAARDELRAEASQPENGSGRVNGGGGGRASSGRSAGPGPASAAAAAATRTGSAGGADGGCDGTDARGQQALDPVSRRLAARLRLARRLGLLPLHRVFKVFAGRPPPAAMTATLHVLLCSDAEAAAIRRAAHAAADAAVAAAGKDGGGSKGARRERQARAAEAAAGGAALAAAAAALAPGRPAAAAVIRVCQHVADRMLGRYTCGVQEDERLLSPGVFGGLAPRLRAAVLARKPEKEALLALRACVSRAGALQESLAAPAERAGPVVAAAAKGGANAGGAKAGKAAATARGKGGASERQGSAAAAAAAADGENAAPFTFGFAV